MSLTERRFITHLVRSFANTLPLDPDDIMTVTAHAIQLPYDANSDYTSSKAIYKADKNLFASHSNYESEL